MKLFAFISLTHSFYLLVFLNFCEKSQSVFVCLVQRVNAPSTFTFHFFCFLFQNLISNNFFLLFFASINHKNCKTFLLISFSVYILKPIFHYFALTHSRISFALFKDIKKNEQKETTHIDLARFITFHFVSSSVFHSIK